MTAEQEAYVVFRALSILTGREIRDPEHLALMQDDPESLVRDLIAKHGADAFNAAWREADEELRDYLRG